VQPLTDFVWTGGNLYEDNVLESTARVFKAFHIGLQSLKTFYDTLTISDSAITPAPIFPFISSCPQPDGTRINFRYIKRLDPTNALYLAKDNDSGRKLIIKFVKRYHAFAHQLLADRGLAPKLYYSALDDAENGRRLGLEIVVMDFVEGKNAHDLFPTGRLPDSKFRFVKEAMDILHAQFIVFGDLRLSNIIVAEDGDKPMLIDFDWCGKNMSARYPPDLNDISDILWHSGVERNGLMAIEHDVFMLNAMRPYPSMDLSL
jgi:hypothetical protein